MFFRGAESLLVAHDADYAESLKQNKIVPFLYALANKRHLVRLAACLSENESALMWRASTKHLVPIDGHLPCSQVFVGAQSTIFDPHFVHLWMHEAERAVTAQLCNDPNSIPLHHCMFVSANQRENIEGRMDELLLEGDQWAEKMRKWCIMVQDIDYKRRQLLWLYMRKHIYLHTYGEDPEFIHFPAKLKELKVEPARSSG
jgi:hypothetical protein